VAGTHKQSRFCKKMQCPGDGGWVIWLAEENAIKVYDEAGTLLKTVSVEMTEKGAAA
jgi:hypothetical protein